MTNEIDTSIQEPTALSISLDASAVLPSELSKGSWYDVEGACHIDDDLHPIPPLEQEDLASTLALALPRHLHLP